MSGFTVNFIVNTFLVFVFIYCLFAPTLASRVGKGALPLLHVFQLCTGFLIFILFWMKPKNRHRCSPAEVADKSPLQRWNTQYLVPVRPYTGAIGDNFILMDDNATPHRARIVNDYLQQKTIQGMDWPARSPDVNPIEHCWDMLQVDISFYHSQAI